MCDGLVVLQGVENKRCYELNEEEINKIREAVGEYNTEADLVRQAGRRHTDSGAVDGCGPAWLTAAAGCGQCLFPSSCLRRQHRGWPRTHSVDVPGSRHTQPLGIHIYRHAGAAGMACLRSSLTAGCLGVPCRSLVCLLLCVQRRVVSQNIKRLKDIGCYRGRRHFMVSRWQQWASLEKPVGCGISGSSATSGSVLGAAPALGLLTVGLPRQHAVDKVACGRCPAGFANTWPADKDQRTHTQGQAKDCGWQEEVNELMQQLSWGLCIRRV